MTVLEEETRRIFRQQLGLNKQYQWGRKGGGVKKRQIFQRQEDGVGEVWKTKGMGFQKKRLVTHVGQNRGGLMEFLRRNHEGECLN